MEKQAKHLCLTDFRSNCRRAAWIFSTYSDCIIWLYICVCARVYVFVSACAPRFASPVEMTEYEIRFEGGFLSSSSSSTHILNTITHIYGTLSCGFTVVLYGRAWAWARYSNWNFYNFLWYSFWGSKKKNKQIMYVIRFMLRWRHITQFETTNNKLDCL